MHDRGKHFALSSRDCNNNTTRSSLWTSPGQEIVSGHHFGSPVERDNKRNAKFWVSGLCVYNRSHHILNRPSRKAITDICNKVKLRRANGPSSAWSRSLRIFCTAYRATSVFQIAPRCSKRSASHSALCSRLIRIQRQHIKAWPVEDITTIGLLTRPHGT